ncbi:RNB domain-containing protein [Flavimobilis soli]|uniref:RNB domain-containing protein n=1 Tax=Flavimobilis soli TaxID=442709 RepID=A0A2A9EDN0_9MICO|nr:RNB domain-containing ribonuclease [Flavimobilis soli]PFG37157.1 RNB domain-containing protein [Flavimobilis soli]
MTRHTMRLEPQPSPSLADRFEALRTELGLEEQFPADALAEAEAAAERVVAELASPPADVLDARDVELVTIDPPGSMDLDQAVHIERTDGGFRVRYAIADVAQAVAPGGALDRVTRERGTTVYGPATRIPLHPPVLSEGVLSLLPDVDRFAYLWDVLLDARGEQVDAQVRRAVVRSRARLSYAQAQAAFDDGSASDVLLLLREVGTLRLERERERGGVSLDVPEQQAVVDGVDVHLEFREVLPVEAWNAQISLLTGMAAARIMVGAGVGILRTLPPADPRDLARLRRAAAALGIEWPEALAYADLLDQLDARTPAHAAFMNEATSLFRGADYLVLDGDAGQPLPAEPSESQHAAIAAHYAHVTAPLRRLVDRYGLAACAAVCAGEPVPAWVREGLVGLPQIMSSTAQRAAAFERGCVDAVEAAVLSGREGEVFDGVVVDTNGSRGRGTVIIAEPAVRAKVSSPEAEIELGARVRVRLVSVDVAAGKVAFELAEAGDGAPSRGR